MHRTIARLACTWLTALAVALPPRGAVAQDTTAPLTAEYVAAVAQLDSALFTLEEARDVVDEAAFNPAALAESLGKDPARIYDFVKYQIGYHPYSGLLRFGPGALMQRAGNSCDKTALLGEMLIAAGEKVQFVLGELSPSDATRLVAGDDGFDPTSTAAPPFPLGREPADIASLKASGLAASTIDAVRADEILYRDAFLAGLDEGLADARSLLKPALDQIAATPSATAAPRVEAPYCWLQRQTPAGFVDLDPTAPWLEAGQRIGEGKVVPALPLTLSPKLGVSVQLERDISGKVETHNVLTAEGRLFQAVNEIELTFLPYGNKADDVLGEPGQKTTYRPVFSLNGIAFAGAGFDLTGLLIESESDKASPIDKPIDILNCIFGCPDKPPAPTRTLNGLTLEITVESADGRKIVERRPLLARPAGAVAESDPALSAQINQRLSFVAAGGRVATDYVVAREVDQVLSREPLLRAVLDAGHRRPIQGDIASLLDGVDLFPVQLIDHLRLRHALAEFSSAREAAPSAYAGFPQIISLREGHMPAATATNRSGALIDIVSSSLDSLDPASTATRAEQGIVDTLAEYLLAGGGNAENAHSILVAAATGGVGTRIVAPGDAAALGAVAPDALSLRGMRDDLAAGYSLLAPERAVTLGDRTAYGWYRFRPETGELVGRGPLGNEGGAETPILTAIVSQQVKMLPISLGMCVLLTAFAHEIGGVQELINEAFGEATPGGPPPPRSFRRVAAEYFGCILLTQALGAAATFGARAAAAAAGAFGGLKAFAGGRPRPAANRPPVVEEPVAPRYAEAEGQQARAGVPPEEPAAVRQGGLVDSRADTVAGRPRVRPGAAGETLSGGAGGARPAPVQAGAPPPPRQPMTARESFNAALERHVGPGASNDPRFIISRARWEGMTPQQRLDAARTFQRLRKLDPFGNPGRQMLAVMEQPIDTPPAERLAHAALDAINRDTGNRLGPKIGQLAEAAGVSPAEMRAILEVQARDLYGPKARIVVDRHGMAHVERMTPEVQAMTPHERALYDLRNQGDEASARRDAKLRAERDTQAGLTADQSIAGQAHYNEIPAAEAMRRTGQTPAEFEANVAAYLETHGLTPEQARAEARAYMHGPEQGGAPPVDRPPDRSQPPGPAAPSEPVVPVEEVALSPDEAIRILDAEMSAAKPEPPAPAPEAQRPSWWDALDTPENAARTSDPQGMSPPERARYEQLFREYQDARQIPEGPKKDVRMWELRQERQGLLEAGGEHQRRVDLRRNQQEATNFNVGAREPNAPTRQVNPESGAAPFRRLVKDDQVYLRSIMEGSGIQPSQSKVYVERINRYTQQILDGGQFPRGKDGAPVKFGRLPNGELIIVSGHHRVIAGQIASRLTGRPLLPQAGGPPSIIPADALTIVDSATRTDASWGTNGMGVLSWPEGAPGP